MTIGPNELAIPDEARAPIRAAIEDALGRMLRESTGPARTKAIADAWMEHRDRLPRSGYDVLVARGRRLHAKMLEGGDLTVETIDDDGAGGLALFEGIAASLADSSSAFASGGEN